MAAAAFPPLLQRVDELLIAPGADAGSAVGCQVRRDKGPERRFERSPAAIRLAARQGVAG